MATTFTPFFQALDGNGDPYSGAKLYFYRTGTSTLLDTYTTSALTTTNANPVVADSAGRFGPIYLGTSYDYKAILTTTAGLGATIATFDPIFASSTAGRVAVADAAYALTASDRLIAYTSLSAARTVTLLAASAYTAGTLLTIVDESGSASSTNTLSVAPNGTDTINGVNATAVVVRSSRGSVTLESDGTSKWTIIKPEVVLPQSYLVGCGMANGTDATNDIDVAAGICRDSTNSVNIVLSALAGKQLDVNWAPGAGAGMRNSGAAITNTTYHIYAVAKAGGAAPDIYAHTSATVATVITALQAESGGAAYLYARRIGSIIRSGATILAFVQDGDLFQLSSPVVDISAANPGTAAVTRTLTLPVGINVIAKVQFGMVSASGGGVAYGYLSDLATTDTAAAGGSISDTVATTTAGNGVAGSGGRVSVRTNTSAQVRSRISFSDANVTVFITTLGWSDRRGREA